MKDLSLAEQKRLAEERANTKAKLREAYKRMYNNPYRQTTINDPALFRYEAARVFGKEFYKITPRSVIFPVGFVVAVVGYQLFLNHEMDAREQAIVSGKTSYYERAMQRASMMD